VDKAVRIFELIALHDEVIRFLLGDLERACREKWDCLIEVDVSAHAPRMQRTLIELGFLPVGYLPALVFHEVERFDVVKMVRLLNPPQVRTDALTPSCAALAELVVRSGECLGEMSLLTARAHSATARTITHVETATLCHQDLAELIRLRPDIGLHIYRNLAVGMGEKLKRLDVSLAGR
jgi:CRP-like cAMP-binding protein